MLRFHGSLAHEARVVHKFHKVALRSGIHRPLILQPQAKSTGYSGYTGYRARKPAEILGILL